MPRWTNRPEGSNWGEFGVDDQLGTLNLLTPSKRLGGIREAREGLAFTLSLPLNFPGGSVLMPHRSEPKIFPVIRTTGESSYNFAFSGLNRLFNDVVSDDAVLLFTQYSTQWDALGHWGQEFDADGDGVAEIVYYNGFRAGEDILSPTDSEGPFARRLGIDVLARSGAQGRATLIDLEAIYGRGAALVGYDALMGAIERQRAEVLPGDFLCLYTGFADLLLEMDRKPDPVVLAKACAVLDGTDGRLHNWIASSGIVAICADNLGVEGVSYSPAGPCDHKRSMMPLHEQCIFKACRLENCGVLASLLDGSGMRAAAAFFSRLRRSGFLAAWGLP
jgi:hypothetical protein